jgi:hypothetical protein
VQGQFEQLMMYYTQLKNMADDMKKMLEKESYNEALTMLNHRERVVKELKLMMSYIELTPAQRKEVDAIREELRVQEAENIEKLQKDMEDVKYELDIVSSKVRFRHKYNPYELEAKSGNVVDTVDGES